MIREFLRSSRMLVGAVVVCVVFSAGLVFWRVGHVGEVVVLDPNFGWGVSEV